MNYSLAYSASDPGIGGVTLTLTGTNGMGQSITATTTTASNGTYTFTTDTNGNLILPGTYTITETAPGGTYILGAAAAGTVAGSSDGTVASQTQITGIGMASGQSGINYYFGAYQPVTIGGYVYVDANESGAYTASDAGVAGVTVTLTGTTGQGQSVTATTTTGSGGAYSFSTDSNGHQLLPGTYTVTETQPSGYYAATTSVGTVNNASDGAVVASGQIGSIAMGSGQTGSNYNFGQVLPITLAGLVYQDSTEIGALANGDTYMSGVTMTLSGTNFQGTSITATTTTDNNGQYAFSTDSNGNQLLPGSYTITETAPTGYAALAANVGTVNNTAIGIASFPSVISAININSGLNGINYDFGVAAPATLSGNAYKDFNNDQVFDSGDTGITGVTVTLTGTTTLGVAVNMTTTTGVNGFYSFTGLFAGSYTITISPPGPASDAVNVGTVGGNLDGVAGTLQISQISLLSGNTGLNYNFGFKARVIG